MASPGPIQMEKELLARGLSSSKSSRSLIFKGIGGKD